MIRINAIRNYFFFTILFFQCNQVQASHLLTPPPDDVVKALKHKPKFETDTFDFTKTLNQLGQCKECGPILESNYRVDVSESRHIIYPDNYQFWVNCKRCKNRCAFNTVATFITTYTQGRFQLRKRFNDKKDLVCVLHDNAHSPHGIFEIHTIGRVPCTDKPFVVITKAFTVHPCASNDQAKQLIAQLRTKKQ